MKHWTRNIPGFFLNILKRTFLASFEVKEVKRIYNYRKVPNLFDKTASNLYEVIARDGNVLLITDKDGHKQLGDTAKKIRTFIVDTADIITAPFIYTIPYQLFAYHTALLKGTDVDQPRNLAKSVTVE